MACLGFNCVVSLFTERTLLELLPHGSMIIMTGQLLILDAASSSHRMAHSVHIVAVCCDIYVTCYVILCVCVLFPTVFTPALEPITNMLSH